MNLQFHFWMILDKSQKPIWNCLHLKNGDIKTLIQGFLCGSNKVLWMKEIHKLWNTLHIQIIYKFLDFLNFQLI